MQPLLVAALMACLAIAIAGAAEPPKTVPSSAINRVRFFPAPGREQAMVGGKITGSNVSEREGFEPIAEITAAPVADQWGEISFPNTKLYRWVRYEAPPGSYGNVAELEFYAGAKLMPGRTFGSFGWRKLRNWPRAFDKKTDTWFDSDQPDGQYVGIDLGEAATAQMPRMDPPPGGAEVANPSEITLRCNTPGAVIRYSFKGAPTLEDCTVYSGPIHLDHPATLFAVAFKEGMPPSPVASGTYLVGGPAKPGLHTFHVGNSLTASTLRLPDFARAAGYQHDYHSWLKNGGNTPFIWQNTQTTGKADWDHELASLAGLDHFSVQPRLAAFTDADLTKEAEHDVLFFNAVRAKFPQVQPWIYAEWPRRWEGELGGGWPGPTSNHEEACSAMMAYIETIEQKVWAADKQGKRARILPCTLAVGQLERLLGEGKIPGLTARDFDPMMYYDNVHPGDYGRYLLCLVWYAAFYGESPIGKIPPVNMNITPAQADALQHLAWDVVKNYPDCGLYEAGTQPCAKPGFASNGKIITLKSATPGAWFRYTLDGTTPTRTHGFVYCGAITSQPGIKLQAVAYKSGMADSEVSAQ
jgi:hypothetical protein